MKILKDEFIGIFYKIKIDILEYQDVKINTICKLNKYTKSFEPDILYIGDYDNLPTNIDYNSAMILLSNPSEDSNVKQILNSCSLMAIAVNYSDSNQLYLDAKSFFLKYQEYKEKLFKMYSISSMNYSYQKIANCLATIFDNPVAISDIGFKTLGYSDIYDVDDYIWTQFTTKHYIPYEYLQVSQTFGLGKVFDSNEPQWSNDSPKNYTRLGCKISMNDKMLGWVTVVEYNKEIDDYYDVKLLKHAAKMLASEFRKNTSLDSLKWGILELYITDMIQNRETSQAVLDERIKYINKRFSNGMSLIAIKRVGASNDYLTLLRSELEMIFKRSITVQIGTTLLLILQGKEDLYNKTSKYDLFVNCIENNNLLVGLGGFFTDSKNIPKYYILAEKAIQLGQIFRADYNIPIYDYNDLSIYHMLESASNFFDLKYFIDPLIYEMINYDKEYSTSYTKSLYIYYQNDLDFSKAAKNLGIHRNTMAYRINKIISIFDRQVCESKNAFKIVLSFRILEYIYGLNFLDALDTIA